MDHSDSEKPIREYSEDVYYERLRGVYRKAIEINIEKNGTATNDKK